MKKKLEKEFLTRGGLLSYLKMTGKKVKDIRGYVSDEFGEPTFRLCTIVFEDDTKQNIEGEHDFPYLVDYNKKTIELMEKLKEEQRNEEYREDVERARKESRTEEDLK